MKKITNVKTSIKEIQVKYTGTNRELDYVDLMTICLDIPPQGGFTPADIKQRVRIQDAIENNLKDGILSLEDADYENLSKMVAQSRWMVRSKELHLFLESFNK